MNSTNSTTSDRGFLRGVRASAFLDCYQEWHAFLEGFCEVLCPWPARHQPSGQLLSELREEHHYYMSGRALGVIACLIIATIIKEVFF